MIARVGLYLPKLPPLAGIGADASALAINGATTVPSPLTTEVQLAESLPPRDAGWWVRERWPEPPKFTGVRDGEMAFFRDEGRLRKQECGRNQEQSGNLLSFAGLELQRSLGAEVMTPRKGSETLVNAAFDHLARRQELLSVTMSSPSNNIKVLDLGTGSGCLLLALLHKIWNASGRQTHHPLFGVRAMGVGVDVSVECLAIAAVNAEACVRLTNEEVPSMSSGDQGLEGVVLCEGTFRDFCGHVSSSCRSVNRVGSKNASDAALSAGPFDVILCNPPYLDENTAALDTSARASDPRLAMFAGQRGMAAYRDLANNPCLPLVGSAGPSASGTLLASGGVMLVEVPHGRAARVVRALLGGSGNPRVTSGDKYGSGGSGNVDGSGSSSAGLVAGLLRDHRGLERCVVIGQPEALARLGAAAM